MIPLSSINIGPLESRYVQAALDATMISSAGPAVPAFEAALARRIGVANVVATSSGTSALELCLRALGIGPGDEVIVPALTFIAPAAAVALVGAEPVVVDVDEETWTIDPAAVRRAICPRTKAIVAVDVFGHPADYDALSEFGLPVIEDAAEAIGARYKGRMAGSLGCLAIFSFHANKSIATGEGGCLCTDDGELAVRARQLGNFGMSPQRRYWHDVPGHNHRMTNLVAAVGLAQMERWDELLGGRARVAASYDAAFAGLGLERRPVAPWANEAVWLYTLASSHREAILARCCARAIDARAVWPIVTEQPAFSHRAHRACPVAQRIAANAFWLPTSSHLSEEAVAQVVQAVKQGLEEGTVKAIISPNISSPPNVAAYAERPAQTTERV